MKKHLNISWNQWLIGWCLVILLAVYLVPNVGFKLPYGMHQWRQCDAYSLALNYFEEERAIFQPAMHFIHGAATGEAVGEFTGTYWLNAQIWKVVGLHPWTMRWMHLLLWLAGLVSLYFLGREWIGRRASAWIGSMVMVSPLMAFYGVNYLVNGASLGLIYVGWWWSYQYFKDGHWKTLTLATVSLSLALLFRPTMAIGLIPLGLAFFKAPQKLRWFGMLFVPLAIAGSWVVWSQAFNGRMESTYFLTTIRPIWDAIDPMSTWKSFTELMLPQWYHGYVRWTVFVGCLVTAFLMHRQLKMTVYSKRGYLGLSALLLFLALVGYFVLWFSNLDVHDYYLIEFQLVVPVLLAWLLYKPKEWLHSGRVRQFLVTLVLPLMLCFQAVEAGLRTRMKYTAPTGWLSEQFIPARERDVWSWFHWDYNRRLGRIEGMGAHLRSMGIGRTDRVISVPDPSPNITLSLMDVRGFTDLYDDGLSGDERIAAYVLKGADVLVCNDEDWYSEHSQSPWLTAPLSRYHSFRLFDLHASEGFVGSVLISKP
jgi:hypothetical protein